MPNWCMNNFSVNFSDESEAERFAQIFSVRNDFTEGNNLVFSMAKMFPRPQALDKLIEYIYDESETIPQKAKLVLDALSNTFLHPKEYKMDYGYIWDKKLNEIYQDNEVGTPLSPAYFIRGVIADALEVPQKDPDFLEVCEQVRSLLNTATGKQEKTLGAAFTSFLQKTDGFVHGLDWARNAWGVKWDVMNVPLEKEGTYFSATFDTPWIPPETFFVRLSQEFPHDTFVLDYCEPGMEIVGETQFHNGTREEIAVDKEIIYEKFQIDINPEMQQIYQTEEEQSSAQEITMQM